MEAARPRRRGEVVKHASLHKRCLGVTLGLPLQIEIRASSFRRGSRNMVFAPHFLRFRHQLVQGISAAVDQQFNMCLFVKRAGQLLL